MKKSVTFLAAFTIIILASFMFLVDRSFATCGATWCDNNGNNQVNYNDSDLGIRSAVGGVTWLYYVNPESGGTASAAPGYIITGASYRNPIEAQCADYDGFFVLVQPEVKKSVNRATGRPGWGAMTGQMREFGGSFVYKTAAELGVTFSDPGSSWAGDSLNGARLVAQGEGEPYSGMPEPVVRELYIKNTEGNKYSAGTLGSFCYGNNKRGRTTKMYSQSRADIPDRNFTTGDTELDGLVERSAGEVEPGEKITIKFTHYLDIDVPVPEEIYDEEFNFQIKGVNNTPSNNSTGISAASSGTMYIKHNNWTEALPQPGKIHRTPQSVGGMYQDTQTVTMPQTDGVEYKVCQSIHYNPKEFTFKKVSGSITHENTGSGMSQACVTFKVKRPDCRLTDTCEKPKICENVPYSSSYFKGDTNVYSGVRNLSSIQYKKWTDTRPSKNSVSIYARPGDSIQFEHAMCIGSHMVLTSDYSFVPPPLPPTPVIERGEKGRTTFGGDMELTWFRVTGKLSGSNYNGVNNKYAFGAAKIVENGPTVTLKKFSYNGGEGSIPIAKESIYNYQGYIDADVREKNAFLVYSPSVGNAGTGNHKKDYICNIYDFAGLHVAPGYQIPGFSDQFKRGCESASKTRKSDAGDIIAQEFEWNNVRAWINDINQVIEPCLEQCYGPLNPGKVQNTQRVGFDAANGSGIRRNTSTIITPICTTCGCDFRCSCGDDSPPTCPCSLLSCEMSDLYRYATDDDLGPAPKKRAEVKVPYNFITEVHSTIQSSEILYTGETVTSAFTWSVKPRKNMNIDNTTARNFYATVTPPDTEVRMIEFVVDSNVTTGLPAAQGNNDTPLDPCSYFRKQFGANNIVDCGTLKSIPGEQNGKGLYEGDTDSDGPITRIVPDNVETGATYCVAVGFYHTDSFGKPNLVTIPKGQDGLSLSGASKNWNVSGASCRTIAKKPNFQVWGAGTYTTGSINTAITAKFNGYGLGPVPSSNAKTIFGSWEEYEVIAYNNVLGFSSAASLGYKDAWFGLPGGHSYTNTFCDFTKMTIENYNCNGPNGIGGGSDIYLSGSTFLDQFSTRYLPKGGSDSSYITGAGAHPLDNGTEYISVSGDATIGNIRRNKDSKTLVIAVYGTATVAGDICYGDGSCGAGDNNLVLGNRNTTVFKDNATGLADIAGLPQVIIFANNININQNVTQMDAWLIADNVDSCADGGGIGSLSSLVCNKTLYVNGPVFANHLRLHRTAGAFPGAETLKIGGGRSIRNPDYYYEGGGVLNQNLANDGSITPGEIFNFRPDALMWAYNQAQRYSQAVVTYSRELAPRY